MKFAYLLRLLFFGKLLVLFASACFGQALTETANSATKIISASNEEGAFEREYPLSQRKDALIDAQRVLSALKKDASLEHRHLAANGAFHVLEKLNAHSEMEEAAVSLLGSKDLTLATLAIKSIARFPTSRSVEAIRDTATQAMLRYAENPVDTKIDDTAGFQAHMFLLGLDTLGRCEEENGIAAFERLCSDTKARFSQLPDGTVILDKLLVHVPPDTRGKVAAVNSSAKDPQRTTPAIKANSAATASASGRPAPNTGHAKFAWWLPLVCAIVFWALWRIFKRSYR